MTDNQSGGIRWWMWVSVILGVPALVLLLYVWVRRREMKRDVVPRVRIEIKPRSRPAEARLPVTKPATAKPDDLKRIEGIGPRISGVLQASGIATFAQLAAADVGRVREILREAGVRADPSTWPEQAGLAASGRWEAFETLQARLKRGKRA